MKDTIDRQEAIDAVAFGITYAKAFDLKTGEAKNLFEKENEALAKAVERIKELSPVQPDLGKYEYHYDHTDCIWYRPEARNRCPVTCAQYRDGWNDAMNYIFRDGKGYRPYRRGEQYEE